MSTLRLVKETTTPRPAESLVRAWMLVLELAEEVDRLREAQAQVTMDDLESEENSVILDLSHQENVP